MLNISKIFVISLAIIIPFRKRIKTWGHRTNYISGGPNLTLPPLISSIILYKKLKVDHFRYFDDAPFSI